MRKTYRAIMRKTYEEIGDASARGISPGMVQWHDEVLTCEWGQYVGGRVALSLLDRDGQVYTKATVNMPDVELAENEVLIKDYSENAGLLNALLSARIVERTGRSVQSGFVTLQVCRLKVEPNEP